MGTNYYLHLDVCSRCGRGVDKIHLGKSSYGWRFSFRGYRRSGDSGEYPHLDLPEQWDLGQVICLEEWTALIRWALDNAGAVIRDEYGQDIFLDDLLKKIELKRDGKSHHQYCMASSDPYVVKHAVDDTWEDAHGNIFTSGYFS